MRVSHIREQHVRFGFSSAQELLRSVEVLLQPSHHAEQMPWIRVARRLLRSTLKTEFAHFRFLFLPAPELFPLLWQDTRRRSAEIEIAKLRRSLPAYSEAVVRRLRGVSLLDKRELSEMLKVSWYRRAASEYASRDPGARAMLAEFVISPKRSLERFCAMLAAVDSEIVQPVWGAIESGVAEDIAMRRRILAKHGVTALLRTLSPALSVRGGRARKAQIEFGPSEPEITFGESSRLRLSPSFFCWPHLQAYVIKKPGGLQCAIAYPIPPLPARVTRLPDRRALAAVATVLGDETRLRMIELLQGRDLSTRELSGFLRMAAPLISRHLRALLQAHLVERYRSGYFVMYRLRRKTFKKTAEAIGLLASP